MTFQIELSFMPCQWVPDQYFAHWLREIVSSLDSDSILSEELS